MNPREASVVRETGETRIELDLLVDGEGQCRARSGVGFLDHMLQLLGYHSRFNIELQATGDLEVDDHHLVEDTGLVLGQALSQALGDKRGAARYGWALIPMDEVLVAAAVDLSGRPVFVSNFSPQREKVGSLSTELVNHFFRSLSSEAKMTLHIRILEPGENEHHRIEAIFKAFARALKMACQQDPGSDGEIPSTKGVV